MSNFSSLEEVLGAIETRFNSALSVSKDPSEFSKEIKNIDNLLKDLNSLIIEKQNEHTFSENEKKRIKVIFSLITKIEKINNNKLGFFDSLNKYFYDNINK